MSDSWDNSMERMLKGETADAATSRLVSWQVNKLLEDTPEITTEWNTLECDEGIVRISRVYSEDTDATLHTVDVTTTDEDNMVRQLLNIKFTGPNTMAPLARNQSLLAKGGLHSVLGSLHALGSMSETETRLVESIGELGTLLITLPLYDIPKILLFGMQAQIADVLSREPENQVVIKDDIKETAGHELRLTHRAHRRTEGQAATYSETDVLLIDKTTGSTAAYSNCSYEDLYVNHLQLADTPPAGQPTYDYRATPAEAHILAGALMQGLHPHLTAYSLSSLNEYVQYMSESIQAGGHDSAVTQPLETELEYVDQVFRSKFEAVHQLYGKFFEEPRSKVYELWLAEQGVNPGQVDIRTSRFFIEHSGHFLYYPPDRVTRAVYASVGCVDPFTEFDRSVEPEFGMMIKLLSDVMERDGRPDIISVPYNSTEFLPRAITN